MKMTLHILLCVLICYSTVSQAEFLSDLPELDRNLVFTQFLDMSKKECSAVMQTGLLKTDRRNREIWAVQCASQDYYLVRLKQDQTGQADIEACDDSCIKKIKAKLSW